MARAIFGSVPTTGFFPITQLTLRDIIIHKRIQQPFQLIESTLFLMTIWVLCGWLLKMASVLTTLKETTFLDIILEISLTGK